MKRYMKFKWLLVLHHGKSHVSLDKKTAVVELSCLASQNLSRIKGVSSLQKCIAALVGECNRVIQCYQLS